MNTKRHLNRPSADFSAHTEVQPRLKDTGVAAPTPNAAPDITSFRVLFAHITWFFIGPLALFLTLLCIVNAGTGWVTILDAVFFVLVGLIVWCRWFDQRSGQGTTSSGEPSTWADFQRYVLLMPVVAGAAWIVANVIGNHLLSMGGG
jgi:hypothetical protein